jgi:tRNA pseudouridine38-40 synthase
VTSTGTATTRRWRLDVSYDGTDFAGWATQPGQRTVQGELERWIPQVLRLDRPVSLVCAGRTDAGVHARGQVAHLDLDENSVPDSGMILLRRLARVLPNDLVVRAVTLAPPGFDARFACLWRRYVYRLWDHDPAPDPLSRREITTVRGPVDLAAMNAAGTALLGLRDFAAFCRRRDGATSIRTLLELDGVRVTDGPLTGLIEFTVRADAFCHSMVRSLIGGLVAVGLGRYDAAWLSDVARTAVRASEVEVMAARGLTLEEVGYPEVSELAERTAQSRSLRTLPGLSEPR